MKGGDFSGSASCPRNRYARAHDRIGVCCSHYRYAPKHLQLSFFSTPFMKEKCVYNWELQETFVSSWGCKWSVRELLRILFFPLLYSFFPLQPILIMVTNCHDLSWMTSGDNFLSQTCASYKDNLDSAFNPVFPTITMKYMFMSRTINTERFTFT